MELVAITGNTYSHRFALRALGAKWDRTRQAWMVPADKADEARNIVGGDGNEPLTATRDIAKAAFPEWKGRKLRLERTDTVTIAGTYWNGGSRNTFIAVELATGRTSAADASTRNPNVFGGHGDDRPTIKIPAGYAVVQHVIFCGKDLGCRVYMP